MNKLDGKAGLYSKDYLLARGHCEWILGRLMELSLTPIRPELSYLHLLYMYIVTFACESILKLVLIKVKLYSWLIEKKYRQTENIYRILLLFLS